MDIREQVIRDCVLLGDFAVKSVETMKAGDEKGVVRLYTGASQANVLMLLTELVDHLAECSSPEDFPGDCAEVRRLRNYSLWAFQGLIERIGNPAGAASEFVLGAQCFFEALLMRDPFVFRMVTNATQRRHYLTLLRFALKLCGFLLKNKWAYGLLCKMFGAKEDAEVPRTRDGEWMKRQRAAVEAEAKATGRRPQDIAEGIWLEHEEEWSCAAHFPEMLRGYASAQSLKKRYYE